MRKTSGEDLREVEVLEWRKVALDEDIFGTKGSSKMPRSGRCFGLDYESCGFLERISWYLEHVSSS